MCGVLPLCCLTYPSTCCLHLHRLLPTPLLLLLPLLPPVPPLPSPLPPRCVYVCVCVCVCFESASSYTCTRMPPSLHRLLLLPVLPPLPPLPLPMRCVLCLLWYMRECKLLHLYTNASISPQAAAATAPAAGAAPASVPAAPEVCVRGTEGYCVCCGT
jgi:hypothetical protein